VERKWLVVFIHSLDGTGYGSWLNTDLGNYLDYLKTRIFGWNSRQDNEIHQGEGVRDSFRIIQRERPDRIDLNDTMDDAVYDEPLTIRSEVPANWTYVTVQQGGSATTMTSTVEGSTNVVYFGAIPDRGSISLVRSASPGILAPTVVTNLATSISSSGAMLNGGVNPNGQATTGWFEWGTSPTLSTFSSRPASPWVPGRRARRRARRCLG